MGTVVNDRIKICDIPVYLYSISGIKRSAWTAYKWYRRGKKSYSGKIIKLKTEKIFGQLFTRKIWVKEFLQEVEE